MSRYHCQCGCHSPSHKGHHGHGGCGCGGHGGGGGHEGHGHGGHGRGVRISRRYPSPKEQRASLVEYIDQLKEELAGAEDALSKLGGTDE